jgi:deoxycytidine triphosphate deaminase
MLLTGEEIKNLKLVSDDSASGYRATSYDLTIGTVLRVVDDGDRQSPVSPVTRKLEVSTTDVVIPPQGMVKVISNEQVALPPDVVGYAFVKNSLCNAGVLAINIGVIDPQYSGPIGSTLINFGANPYPLQAGEPFLRLTFHKLQSTPHGTPAVQTREAYLSKTKREVLANSSGTFLNVDRYAELAANRAFGEAKQYLTSWWIPIIGLFLVFLTMLVPIGAELVGGLVPGYRESVAHDITQKIDQSYAQRIANIERELIFLRSSQDQNNIPADRKDPQ